MEFGLSGVEHEANERPRRVKRGRIPSPKPDSTTSHRSLPPSYRTFFRFISTQLPNESSRATQLKIADLKSDGLLGRYSTQVYLAKRDRSTRGRARARRPGMNNQARIGLGPLTNALSRSKKR